MYSSTFGKGWVGMSACPLVVLACESLHVCTVCIWRCEHARFCVEGFYALYINFHSFIHTNFRRVNPFNITLVKRAHKTCWYRRPFRLIYRHQVKKEKRKRKKGMDRHNFIFIFKCYINA